jgi:integrase
MFKGSVYCRRWTYVPKDENGNPIRGAKPKNGRAWGVRWSVNDGPITRKIVADTKEGAADELDKIREDYKRRLLGVAEGKTLNDLAPLYLEHQRTKERDMGTIESRLKNLLAFFGETRLEDIEEQADKYKLARRATYRKQPCKKHADGERCPKCDQRISKGTVNREIAVLNHMLHLASKPKFKMLRYRPEIERLEGEAGPRERELSEAEEAKLLPVCPPDLQDLILAALSTGMREGELIKLTRAQIDLETRLINFPPTKKGLKRFMPINERLYYVLCRRCARLSPSDLVFSVGSHPWQRWHIRNRLAVAVRTAGILPIRFHDLRHTVGSRLRRAGADMDYIRKVLGHRNVQTTDGYVHYEAEQLRPILALLGTPNPSTTGAQVDFHMLTSTREAQEPADVLQHAVNSLN